MQKFELELKNGMVISSALREDEVSALPAVHPRDIGNGYIFYWLPVIEFNEVNVVFGFSFLNGSLRDINVSLSNPELYGDNWDDFSEKKEKLRAKLTEEWLSQLGYKVGKFPWGSIWAGYEGKGGFGHAVIQYNS
tara:strand:- start:80 stop:484 length:405 start_codon:yes stop_codon:yes gene_type:complete